MALIVIPSLLSKRPWARIRARCAASFFIVLSKSSRCCSVRGHTYLTIIHLGIGFTYRIVLKLSREILYQKTFGRALTPLPRTAHDGLRHSMRAGPDAATGGAGGVGDCGPGRRGPVSEGSRAVPGGPHGRASGSGPDRCTHRSPH